MIPGTHEREDVPDEYRIPRALGEWFLEQARRYATTPAEELQRQRNARESRWSL